MSNTIRIRTEPNGNDKYLKIKLQQDWDFIEILSLKISQEETYRKFCSDYGAIVGRVIINNGFGVPNAKVSVFIPLDDIDKNDPLISGLYPFEVISDKDSEGIRYNLFPKDNASTNNCYSPIGTFPNKREVLDNETLLNVYCKYYKFTTTTNHAGDFMIFGVPLGTYTVHVDVDLSDIGIASQRPYDLINQGVSEKLFLSPTKFNIDKNIDKLAQVKTLNAGVNVQPFWGDQENCEIGITRLDFDLNHSIVPSAIFMGSIYGDQDKHSINKHCRPRNKMGSLCEQVAGPGSVDMIRQTIDGKIEEFSVEGGRVIDDNGTWAYQIPMNLDYMVTAEDGSLLLSQDPNVGIPTRTRVRFKIGMDETGGEGRLRTRAKYLVPNNPKKPSEVDYTFDETTKDTSFRDLHWNKIYSISNYITRFQKKLTLQPEKTRNMTAIKDVDGCGDKNPHPYNRVNGQVNPIFFAICLILKMVIFLIYTLNAFVFWVINAMIYILNGILGVIHDILQTIIDAINSLGGSLDDIPSWALPYVPCIAIECDSKQYSPGCNPSSLGYQAAVDKGVDMDANLSGENTGLDDCISFEVAGALNMYEFDFYNDWVNGSLFGFLLKYKKKHKGIEKFCEYDCGPNWNISNGGVDGNNDNVSDNKCQENLLIDSCFNNPDLPLGQPDWQHGARQTEIVKEGLIKKVGDEYFYAATTHDIRYKLFATEVINLGSVFNCDWQGIPSIQNLLIPTSYKIPPDTGETNDDTGVLETCGMVEIGPQIGTFFSIDCLGLHVDERGCLNLRHICEIGVEIDQEIQDNIGQVLSPADCVIGSLDIPDTGRYLRDIFYGLNSSSTPWIGLNVWTGGTVNTSFNINTTTSTNLQIYDFANSNIDNGQEYLDFRRYGIGNGNGGVMPVGDNAYGQTNHSYFFYFGLLPGKTALDKMNKKFFTTCKEVIKDSLLIRASSTVSISINGTLTFEFVGGSGPYTYTITGPSTSITGTVNTPNSPVIKSGLDVGIYIITGFDALGTPADQTIVITGPPPFYSSVSVTKNATNNFSANGEITISSVGGGQAPYNYIVTTASGVPVSSGIWVAQTVITGLAGDNVNGYVVTIADSSNIPQVIITSGLIISYQTILNIGITKTDVTCYGGNDGKIILNITGGQTPYTINTTAIGYLSNSVNMSGLVADTYTIKVVDNLGTVAFAYPIISTINPQMVIATATANEMKKQCSSSQYLIPFKVTTAPSFGLIDIFYELNNDGIWHQTTVPYSSGLMYLPIPTANLTINIKIKISNSSAGTCFSNTIIINKAAIQVPLSNLTSTVVTNGTGPYTYTVSGSGGIAPYTGEGTFSSPYSTTITDSVGCTTPLITG